MIHRVLAQYDAFDNITLTCDRCEKPTPLMHLHPTRNLSVGFVCTKCLQSMPHNEYIALRPSD